MGEIIDKLKGKAKQVEGDITGDRERHAEGRVDEAKGKAKGAFEEIKQDVKDAFKK
ncbi:MAG: CsbD-like [Myxococcales bacterium]|nr:CsbD-like [Myxococcales bacterium]